MKAFNELRVNEATLIEMVQHYFQTKMFQTAAVPTVTSITTGSSGTAQFVIGCSDEKQKHPDIGMC